MVAIPLRSSTLAVKIETTEGTPLAPTAATDFVKIQDDVSLSPNAESLENAELTGSIGPAKPIRGVETPTASFSKYLNHSGVEGQEPQYGPILEALFGSKNVYAAAEATVASATETAITLGGGEGANYARGYGLLIKDGTNGFRIRVVESVAGDVLTLNMPLPTGQAPAAGVKVGLPITYIPTNKDHPSLTIWNYLGDGGATQMIAGARTLSWDITADAGQLINGSFSFEGVAFYWNPTEITASNQYVDFTDDDGTFAATVTTGWYQDPGQLAAAVASAMNNTATTQTHACTFQDSDGKFTISTSTSAVLSLLWNTGANTANTIGGTLGYATAADDTGATTYEADNAQTYDAPFTASFDSADPIVAKNQEVMIGLPEQDDIVCFEASSISIAPSNTKANINSICATTGISSSVISARTTEITVVGLLNKHEQDEFQRFRENQTIKFQYSFGPKANGSDYDAGLSGSWSSNTCVISSLEVTNIDDIARLSMTLNPFVEDGNGELYLNFL